MMRPKEPKSLEQMIYKEWRRFWNFAKTSKYVLLEKLRNYIFIGNGYIWFHQ